ncbi:molecular chaperone [Paenibacillus sp. VTT E-133280]|jgi:SPX domain protein involved in polyphosphate accumulation|uniref:polyphosphate polymerase domain-containing protein n=1 Tax=Paenibacillus TaxID=44249 RepID=UPI000BA0A2C5|nr:MULTISPECIES: polyphosphate polymerase domain-containing protein [unclassified Paenibacillus]MDH6372713.1 SPX domain protein involved in polyphosphate accumulation [Paenibacillus sp. PastF-3]OZQ70535.1 molecular chaperone [Paenibacillus sp. VTT E-133280]OZQ97977.1 molecular chaperone [Paenibacillus sp. VTT E-133291]
MAIEVFNRYENKYLLDNEAYYKFYNQLLEYMELDDFNKQHEFYSITNLYYDTAHNTLIRNSLAKPKYKEKLRLRAYGVPNQDTKVYLEIKKKVFGLVNKRRTSLKLDEAYAFVATGREPEFEDYMNKQVIEEIKYFLTRYELQPKVYLSYDRKALFCKNNRDLRITFDTNIRSRRYDLKMEHGVYGEPLLEPGQWLMEVKAENTIPVWLAKMLSEHQMYRTSFSKYGNEYKKMLKNSKTDRGSALYA